MISNIQVIFTVLEQPVDVSSLVRDYKPTDRASSEDFHHTVSTGTITFEYDSGLVQMLLGGEEIRVSISVDGVQDFTGRVSPATQFDSRGASLSEKPDVSDLSLEIEDNSFFLEKKISGMDEIAWENHKVCDPTDTGNSIVHKLLALSECTQALTLEIDVELRAFSADQGSIAEILDSLLFEYGYIWRFDEQGRFVMTQWMYESNPSAITIDHNSIMGALEVEKIYQQKEAVELTWYQLKEKQAALLYMADLPFGNDNRRSGWPIQPGYLWPEEANVEEAWWNYQDAALTSQISADGKIKPNKDYSSLVLTKNHAISERFDPGIVREVCTFRNKKARLAYRNSSADPALIFYVNITGDVVYKGAEATERIEMKANPGEVLSLTAKYIHDELSAKNLCSHLAEHLRNASWRYSFLSEETYPVGTVAHLIDQYSGVSVTALLIERERDLETEVHKYKAIGISPTAIITGTTEIVPLPSPPASAETPISMIENTPTFSDLQQGYSQAGGTTVPTIPILELKSGPQSIFIYIDEQKNLTNYSHDEIQVTDDVTGAWYALGQGEDWKGASGGKTSTFLRFHIHANIPTVEAVNPETGEPQTVPRSLFYRARRVTKAGMVTDWTSPVQGTAGPIDGSSVAEHSIAANKLDVGVLNALFANVNQRLTVGQSGYEAYNMAGSELAPGDTRIYMDKDEVTLQECIATGNPNTPYNATWNTLGSITLGHAEGQFFPQFNIGGAKIQKGIITRRLWEELEWNQTGSNELGNENLIPPPVTEKVISGCGGTLFWEALGKKIYRWNGSVYEIVWDASSYPEEGYHVAPYHNLSTWTTTLLNVIKDSSSASYWLSFSQPIDDSEYCVVFKSSDGGKTWDISPDHKFFMSTWKIRGIIEPSGSVVMQRSEGTTALYLKNGSSLDFLTAALSPYEYSFFSCNDYQLIFSSPTPANEILFSLRSGDAVFPAAERWSFSAENIVVEEVLPPESNNGLFIVVTRETLPNSEIIHIREIQTASPLSETIAEIFDYTDTTPEIGSCTIPARETTRDNLFINLRNQRFAVFKKAGGHVQLYLINGGLNLGNEFVSGLNDGRVLDLELETEDQQANHQALGIDYVFDNDQPETLYVNGDYAVWNTPSSFDESKNLQILPEPGGNVSIPALAGGDSTLLSYQKDSTSRSFGTSWADGWTTEPFTIPSGAVIKVDFAIPARNDSTSWGGGYTEILYEIDGSGVWSSLGSSGYDMVMATSAGVINTYNNDFVQDFSGESVSHEIRYKFRHRSYDGTLEINGSHAIYGESYAWTHIIAYQLRGARGPVGEKGDPGEPGPVTVVPSWTSGTYDVGARVGHAGKVWEAAVSTSQEPGIGTDWEELSTFADVAWPVGSTYWQLPGKKSPVELGLPGTWQNISDDFAGDFFRAEGGEALPFEGGEQADQNKAHDHGGATSEDGAHSHTYYSGWNTTTSSGAADSLHFYKHWGNAWRSGWISTSGNHSHQISNDGGIEARPVNKTIRIWERIS